MAFTLVLSFCSCQTIKHNSVEEYAAQVSSQGYGYSDIEIDNAKDFFPRWFTMACYNDSKNELVFIEFYTTKLPDGLDISQETWKEFIDKYYGEYHDFNQ